MQAAVLGQLYVADTDGVVEQVDPDTGAVLVSPVGGVTDARGMEVGPSGGLYVARASEVSVITVTGVTPFVVYAGETPHDVTFDALGHVLVVTDLQVHIHDAQGTQLFAFPHGLTSACGDGNGDKGWSLAEDPVSGDIFVTGREGVRSFDATTGALQASIVPPSSCGAAGIAFTQMGFNGAFLYVGSILNGVDRINVYDQSLNFLRVFAPPHNGNPIDLAIDPATGDIFVANTINPCDRYSSSELLIPVVGGLAGDSRSLAIGAPFPPWFDLGGGTVGSAGTPTLVGSGTLVGGTAAGVALTNAPPSAPMLAWISFAPTPLFALGGTVHAYPFASQLFVFANGSGAFSAMTTWPAGLPVGSQVFFQFLIEDASTVHGLSLSNGLLATTP